MMNCIQYLVNQLRYYLTRESIFSDVKEQDRLNGYEEIPESAVGYGLGGIVFERKEIPAKYKKYFTEEEDKLFGDDYPLYLEEK